MSFMIPEIIATFWYEVQANHGETHVVPCDASGICLENHELADYVEGTIDDPDALTTSKMGYLARLAAPGFMDCTSWAGYKTEREAIEGLLESEGSQEEPKYWESWEYDLHRRLLEIDGLGRFEVCEFSSGYSVRDRITDQDHLMSDGVDVLTSDDPENPAPAVGTEEFRAAWEAMLNADEEETLLAYFPDQHQIEIDAD
jgi:hypothetical protein